jgi:hypothetical protein
MFFINIFIILHSKIFFSFFLNLNQYRKIKIKKFSFFKKENFSFNSILRNFFFIFSHKKKKKVFNNKQFFLLLIYLLKIKF